MSAREAILHKLRAKLDGTSTAEDRRQAARARIAAAKRNLVPARAQLPKAEQVDLFQAQAEAVEASVARVSSLAEIPEHIADYLRQHNLPQALRHGEDTLLNELAWAEKTPALEVGHGPARANDEVSLSRGFGGVAETGTLVLASGADNPTTLNFLPENHIVILRAGDVEGSYEDVWEKLRRTYGKGEMPRTVNMITGPSRTGDIEQKIELGAHGPRRLHIVILED